jgi:hypothetical protein
MSAPSSIVICGFVVLRAQRVRGADVHLRPTVPQRKQQVRRLRRDVQARADAYALQRLFSCEALADLGDDGHLA